MINGMIYFLETLQKTHVFLTIKYGFLGLSCRENPSSNSWEFFLQKSGRRDSIECAPKRGVQIWKGPPQIEYMRGGETNWEQSGYES